jgi:hypothetical protein
MGRSFAGSPARSVKAAGAQGHQLRHEAPVEAQALGLRSRRGPGRHRDRARLGRQEVHPDLLEYGERRRVDACDRLVAPSESGAVACRGLPQAACGIRPPRCGPRTAPRGPGGRGALVTVPTGRNRAGRAVLRDEHLRLELDALRPRRGDQAFDADHHVLVEPPLRRAEAAVDIDMQRHHRPFVHKPHTVDRERIAEGPVDLGDLPALLVELGKAHVGAQDLGVLLDLVQRHPVERLAVAVIGTWPQVQDRERSAQ